MANTPIFERLGLVTWNATGRCTVQISNEWLDPETGHSPMLPWEISYKPF
jgi:hypothetical protein